MREKQAHEKRRSPLVSIAGGVASHRQGAWQAPIARRLHRRRIQSQVDGEPNRASWVKEASVSSPTLYTAWFERVTPNHATPIRSLMPHISRLDEAWK